MPLPRRPEHRLGLVEAIATPPFGPCVGAGSLFDDLVRAQHNRWGYSKPERPPIGQRSPAHRSRRAL